MLVYYPNIQYLDFILVAIQRLLIDPEILDIRLINGLNKFIVMRHIVPRHITIIILISILIAMPFSSVYSQGSEGLNWSTPNYDKKNTRFNPQTVINQDNVENLEMRWIYRLPRNPYIGILEPSEGFQVTPLVVNGILYYSTSFGHIVAVSTLTSRTVWTFNVNVTAALEKPWIINRGIQRSLTYSEGSIYFTSIDCTIYGLEAITGEITIEIPDTCKDIPGNQGRYYGEEAPTIYGDIAIVGSASGFGQARGYAAAYNLKTGELLWRWFTTPPMTIGEKEWNPEWEKGNLDPFPNDWGDNDNIVPYGGAVRTDGVVDEETGIIYLGTALPGLAAVGIHGHPNQRMAPGPNLYSNAIVALKIETGELVWYYQIEPHGVRRQGIYYNIILADISIGGDSKKTVIGGSFQGFVYFLDANDGTSLIDPVAIGKHNNPSNVNLGNNANMSLAQQVGDKFCPGAEGGLAGPLAFNDGKVFAASRNDCFEIRARVLDITPEDHDDDEELPAFIYATDLSQPQNSNIRAIDTSTGNILWSLDLPNLQWGAGVTVSAGVIYALDFIGTLHMINSDTGEEIDRLEFGGSGTAGVSIASAANGEIMVFIVTGGDETLTPTDGIITAFALREDEGSQGFSPLITYASIAVAAISISFAILLLFRKS